MNSQASEHHLKSFGKALATVISKATPKLWYLNALRFSIRIRNPRKCSPACYLSSGLNSTDVKRTPSNRILFSPFPFTLLNSPIEIRSLERNVEIAWFSALYSDDYELLGVPAGQLRNGFEHRVDIVKTAYRLGYQNILRPSSFQVGQEPLRAAMAASTEQINQQVAIRTQNRF